MLSMNLKDEDRKVVYNEWKEARCGRLIIRYDEVIDSKNNNEICVFSLSTHKMNIPRFFVNLFIRIYRKSERDGCLLVYESTRCKRSMKNKRIKLKGSDLCNSDYT